MRGPQGGGTEEQAVPIPAKAPERSAQLAAECVSSQPPKQQAPVKARHGGGRSLHFVPIPANVSPTPSQ